MSATIVDQPETAGSLGHGVPAVGVCARGRSSSRGRTGRLARILEGADGAQLLSCPLLQKCESSVKFVLRQVERARIGVNLDAEKH